MGAVTDERYYWWAPFFLLMSSAKPLLMGAITDGSRYWWEPLLMGAITDGCRYWWHYKVIYCTPYIKFLMYSGFRGFVISRNKFYFWPQASRRFTKCKHKFGCFKNCYFSNFLTCSYSKNNLQFYKFFNFATEFYVILHKNSWHILNPWICENLFKVKVRGSYGTPFMDSYVNFTVFKRILIVLL